MRTMFIILTLSFIALAFAIGFISGLIISDILAYNYIVEVEECSAGLEDCRIEY
jgi:hypothetical protein